MLISPQTTIFKQAATLFWTLHELGYFTVYVLQSEASNRHCCCRKIESDPRYSPLTYAAIFLMCNGQAVGGL